MSVAYFRAGYAPGDYTGEADWAARETLERALCVKCPSVHQQLAGTKKVQQVLAQPGEVERFLPAADAALLRTCFAKLYGLEADGGAAVDAIVQAGTNLSGIDIFPTLEKQLGKPVIPINVATIWHALRAQGVDDKIYGRGWLMERF